MKKIAILCCIALISMLVVVPAGNAGGSKNEEVETEMSTVFDVGMMVKGSFQPVGSIAFDADNTGVLSVTESGKDADKLQKAWEEISGQEVLSVRRSKRVKNDDGSTEMRFIGVNVERSNEGYPQAVMDYLSNKYGFFGKPAR